MREKKNAELNFLYMDVQKSNKNITKSKKKNVRAGGKSALKENTFDFDNEIVIGVTKVPDAKDKEVVKSKKKRTTTKKTNGKVNSANKKNSTKSNTNKKNTKDNRTDKNNKKTQNNKNRKNVIIKGIIKWTILCIALIASFIYFMMSPLFNLAEIQVQNNEKISTDTIISLSGLKIGDNIYKTSINNIRKNIKQNAYIESVNIKRKLPNKIQVTVEERKTTYNLEYANSFVYINNQGYILDILESKLEVPIIEGYTTSGDSIIVGNRLNDEDLEKLGTVLKIVESANVNDIGNFITRINISDKQNYTIVLEGEKKKAYLGDASNLSTRMLYVKAILTEERGIEGEIFVNGDLNKNNVYFRRKE